jgi:hypothetical protein
MNSYQRNQYLRKGFGLLVGPPFKCDWYTPIKSDPLPPSDLIPPVPFFFSSLILTYQ